MKKNMQVRHFRTNFKDFKLYDDSKVLFKTTYEKENPSSEINNPKFAEKQQLCAKAVEESGLGASADIESFSLPVEASLNNFISNK